jgi:hypothetical protein
MFKAMNLKKARLFLLPMMGRRDTSGIIGSTENRWENHGTQWGIFQLARELIAGGYELLLKIHWNSEVFLFFCGTKQGQWMMVAMGMIGNDEKHEIPIKFQ